MANPIIMDKPPTLSVLMCVFNGEEFLREAIQSVLTQTFSDFEFIIVDDGSTDRTAAILAAHPDARIRIIRNEKNLGLIPSLNIGLGAAQGEFIARMDADDICIPTRFERQIGFLQNNPDTGISGSWLQIIGEEAQYTFPVTHEEIKVALLDHNALPHPSVLFRRAVVKGLAYEPDFYGAEDYELWTRLAGVTRLANLPETLLLYRKHDQQVTRQKMEAVNATARKIKLRLLRCLDIRPDERESMVHLFLFNNDHKDLIHQNILAEADEWLYKLFMANRNTRQFDE